jgi:integrase
MRVEDIDFRRHTVVVRGKGSERRVFFGRPAKKSLRRYLGKRKKGIVFLTDNLRQRGCVSCSSGQWNGYWRDYTQGPGLIRSRVKYLGPPRLKTSRSREKIQGSGARPEPGTARAKAPDLQRSDLPTFSIRVTPRRTWPNYVPTDATLIRDSFAGSWSKR